MNIPKQQLMPKYEFQKQYDQAIDKLNLSTDNDIKLNDYHIRDKIFAAERWMKEQPQLELKVFHHFSYGIYARELHIPEGTILTGEIHKFENLNILSKGRISVLTEEGIKEVGAPFTVVSPPGTKRIAYAHTDCIWTTIHGTFERDLDIIKQQFVATTEKDWLEFCGANQLLLALD